MLRGYAFTSSADMKICPECGGEFKNLGSHMKKHSASINVREQAEDEERLQEANEKGIQATKEDAVRPIDRINRRVVFQGQSGIIRR